MATAPHYAIQRVSIAQLFGKYDFDDIPLWGMASEAPNVAFIYGDNGVGKTTILNLIYATLSAETEVGLRGYLSRTKFNRLSIIFGDGQSVSVVKEPNKLTGVFRYVFSGPRHNFEVKISPTRDGAVYSGTNPRLALVEEALRTLSVLIMIDDRRVIRTNREAIKASSSRSDQDDLAALRQKYLWEADRPDSEGTLSAALEEAIRQTNDYFVSKAVISSSAGDRSANQVYLDVLRAMRKAGRGKEEFPMSKEDILASLEALRTPVSAYERYNILSNVDINSIYSEVAEADNQTVRQLSSVIAPYIRSLHERVMANENLVHIMSAFESNLNLFLRRKQVVVDLVDGIRFVDTDGNVIPPSALSSGERHLVFLICSTVAARNQPTVILVDEPELSLNYIWQRNLTHSLLSLAGAGVQFIMATHSFEVLGGASSAAVSLDPRG